MEFMAMQIFVLFCCFGSLASSNENMEWMEEIRQKVIDMYHNNAETLTRILFYLEQEDKAYKDDERIPPVWKMLNSTLYSDEAFKYYTSRLAEDTKREANNEKYSDFMRTLYNLMLDATDTPLEKGHGQGFVMKKLHEDEITQSSALIGLARGWSKIPKESQSDLIQLLPKLIKSKPLSNAVDAIAGSIDKTGGKVVVPLVMVYLTHDTLRNLNLWWNDEISGARCAKNIIDHVSSVSAGIAGGMAGAAIGSCLGPAGTIVGGIAGGVVCSATANVLSDRITQWLFGLPKDKALENAYNYLGVKMTASNHDVNTAFRLLALKYHPDKGGSSEEFYFLQFNMAVIKAARGELYN